MSMPTEWHGLRVVWCAMSSCRAMPSPKQDWPCILLARCLKQSGKVDGNRQHMCMLQVRCKHRHTAWLHRLAVEKQEEQKA